MVFELLFTVKLFLKIYNLEIVRDIRKEYRTQVLIAYVELSCYNMNCQIHIGTALSVQFTCGCDSPITPNQVTYLRELASPCQFSFLVVRT